jgi:uncharacterized protein (DUF2236 family)
VRDHGILATDSVARRINRETFLLLGGTAALLMQVAHPLVAAGVDQHSSFRVTPIPRLMHTIDTTLGIVFGDRAQAERGLRRIDRVHASVKGNASDGRAYRARDPKLLLWVQTTLVLTSLRWYEMVMGRLADADREAYWDEGKLFANKLGVPAKMFPNTVTDLERYECDMLRHDVIPDATATSVGRDILRPFPALPGSLHWPNDAITAALLPETLRTAFGLRYRTAERRFVRGAIVAIRAARPALPRRLAVVPQARRYEAAFGGSVKARR